MTVANYVNLLEEQGARPGTAKPDVAMDQSKGRAQQGRASARATAANTVPGSGATPDAQMKKPAGSKVGRFFKALARPRSVRGGVDKLKGSRVGTAARVGGKVLGKAGVAGLALEGGIRAIDAASSVANEDLDYLHERMLSDDPTVSKAAIAEYRASQGQEQAPEESPVQANEGGQVAPGQGVNPNDPGQPESDLAGAPAPGNDEAAVEVHLDETGGTQAGPEQNAALPRPIAGTEYEDAGRYGDTDVLRRDTVPSGRPDGDVVPEFSDQASSFGGPANGLPRPGQQQADAEQRARAEESRQDYVRNTTMSDGRRVFGGGEGQNTIGPDGKVQFGQSATERLRGMQLEQAKKGDPDGTVTRQLAEEGRTPEHIAAYAADPAGTYATDQATEAAVAKNRLDSFKDNFDMQRDVSSDARAERTEGRRSAKDSHTQLTSMLKGWETTAGPERQAVMSEAMAMLESPGNDLSISQIVQQIMGNVQTDGELPILKGGKLQYKQQAPGQNGGIPRPTKEVAPFI